MESLKLEEQSGPYCNLIVAGSRGFSNFSLLRSTLDDFIKEYPYATTIISGGAKGADLLAEKYATSNNIPIKVYKANWRLYGKSAGPIRNQEMASVGDVLIAFWDGKSNGTMDMINRALSSSRVKEIRIIKYGI